MLLKHSGQYALARGLPGLVNLLAIVVFSRLLTAEEYGHYALVVAGAGFASGVLFQWLRLCVLRFLPAHHEHPHKLLSPILSGFIIAVAVTALGGGLVTLFVEDPVWKILVAVGIALVWAKGWYALNQGIARSRLSPRRYGFLSGTKAIVALIIGVGLVILGLGGLGALVGLVVGLTVAPFVFSLGEWRGVRPVRFSIEQHRYLLTYGLPLAVNSILVWLITSSDRLLLGWLLDAEATGQYAVGYDLAQSSLGMVLMVVNLAAYPLAVESLERKGADAAREQLRSNEALFLGVGIPGAVGLALLAPEIADIFVGPEFRSAATMLIPWIAFGSLLSGIKLYHFDLAFQLGGRTVLLVWVSLAAGLVNLALNLLWIPRFGLMGSAYATVIAYGVALWGSVLLGDRAFRVPWAWSPLIKTGLATLVMALILYIIPSEEGILGLVRDIVVGIGAYGLIAISLNVAGVRSPIRAWIKGIVESTKSILKRSKDSR